MATRTLTIRIKVDDRLTGKLKEIRCAIKKLMLIHSIRKALRRVNGFT